MNRICNIASRIRQIREKIGWSQEQLAHKANIDRKTVSRIENGDYSAQWRTIVAVFKELGVAQCEECKNCQEDGCEVQATK